MDSYITVIVYGNETDAGKFVQVPAGSLWTDRQAICQTNARRMPGGKSLPAVFHSQQPKAVEVCIALGLGELRGLAVLVVLFSICIWLIGRLWRNTRHV